LSTIVKALDILELFSPAQPSLGLSETARLLGRDKASVLRHLSALEQKGFVEQDSKTKFYHLGPALSRLSMVREQTAPANHAISNLVQKLALDTGETTHLSRYSNGRLIHGKIVNSQSSGVRVHLDPNEELPLHATASGIAFLSVCHAEILDQTFARLLTRYTDTTPTDRDSVMLLSNQAADLGFAVGDGTYEADAIGIAAPVFNVTGEACGSLAVSTPRSRLNDNKKAHIIDLVRRAAAEISWHQGAPKTKQTAPGKAP
jgi:DNA-binding IclR family transcriptional regulator